MRHAWLVARGSAVIAWNQKVASAATVLIVAGMCVAILLTAGRTAAAQTAVTKTLESAAGRTILVQAEPGAGLTTDVLQRLQRISGIEQSYAMSDVIDVVNSELYPSGMRVPMRHVYSGQATLGITSQPPVEGAYISHAAQQMLQFRQIAGGLTDTDTGQNFNVVGFIPHPGPLSGLGPLVLMPITDHSAHNIGLLVVVARSSRIVAPVASAVESMLGAKSPDKVKVSMSEQFVSLQTLIGRQLSTYGNALVLLIAGLTMALIAVIMFALVTLRRKDFGRRRALGASRTLILGLLASQVAILSIVGAALGISIAAIILVASNDPMPDITYLVAVGTLAVGTGVGASLPPAVIAARRDPLHELRVP